MIRTTIEREIRNVDTIRFARSEYEREVANLLEVVEP